MNWNLCLKKSKTAAHAAETTRENNTMLRQDMESIYATVFMVHDMNRQHREEMMRRADHERLVRSISTSRQVGRAVLAWTGRRLVASGHYLLNRAERPAGELTLAPME